MAKTPTSKEYHFFLGDAASAWRYSNSEWHNSVLGIEQRSKEYWRAVQIILFYWYIHRKLLAMAPNSILDIEAELPDELMLPEYLLTHRPSVLKP